MKGSTRRSASASLLSKRVHAPASTKGAKESLRHIEERLGLLVSAVRDYAILMLDPKGIVVSWNAGAEQIKGYRAEEIIGRHFSTFYPAEDVSQGKPEHALKIATQQGRFEDEGWRMRKDGSSFWANVVITALRDEAGQLCGFGKVTRDLTERKKLEETLRSSEARYHTLFKSIDEGFCIIEMIFDEYEKPVDYRFLEINPSFENQTGLHDALGKRMRELAPGHEQHWFEIYGHIAVTGEAARFQSRAEQLHRWYDVYAFRFGEPKNRQVAILFSDITEQKATEMKIMQLNVELQQQAVKLELANKELEAFCYSVAHDLRAPLRSIDGFARILFEDYGDKLDQAAQDSLHRVSASSQKMARLIDDLLKLSRITRAEMVPEPVDLSVMAQEIVDELREAGPPRAVDVKIADGLTAQGDARLLRAALQNLLANAWKFTAKCGRAQIEVGSAQNNGDRVFFVRDNGAGFEMEYVHKLFGAFQRLHSAAEFEGNGIGLATVQRIIQRHGGRVWAEGAVGKGATFYFSL